MTNNNIRQVFHTQGFEYPKQPAVLTAAINRKAGSDSHLPRFFFGLRVGSPAEPENLLLDFGQPLKPDFYSQVPARNHYADRRSAEAGQKQLRLSGVELRS